MYCRVSSPDLGAKTSARIAPIPSPARKNAILDDPLSSLIGNLLNSAYTILSRDARLPVSQASVNRPFPLTTQPLPLPRDRKSTRLNSSHGYISYAVFCLKKK